MNLPYYFDENIEQIKAVASEPGSDRTALLKMDEKEFDKLKYSIRYMTKFMRDFESTVKSVNIERRNDYSKMIKNARKLFSDIDIDILEYLSDELAYYTSGIVEHVGRGDLARTKKSLKLLKRRGLIEIVNGLFDEDGFTAGSGWMKVDHKLDENREFIVNYSLPDEIPADATVRNLTQPAEPIEGQKFRAKYLKQAYSGGGYQKDQIYDLVLEKIVWGKPIKILKPIETTYRDMTQFKKDWQTVA